MFPLDYRDSHYERHLRQLGLRYEHHRRQLAAARRPRRRLLSLVGRGLISLGDRLVAPPTHERARSR